MNTYKSAATYETYETKLEDVRISADSTEFFVILAHRYGFMTGDGGADFGSHPS